VPAFLRLNFLLPSRPKGAGVHLLPEEKTPNLGCRRSLAAAPPSDSTFSWRRLDICTSGAGSADGMARKA